MYHEPVLLQESIEGLAVKPNGIYVDATFGGGGHSREILKLLENGKLYAFDQDEDAKKNADRIEDKNFVFVEANFRYMKRYLKLHGVHQVDGILADLGVSSHQIDTAERGFSTRYDAELDMRMDQKSLLTAKDLINKYEEQELRFIFRQYGELPNPHKLARAITSARVNKSIDTVNDLKEVLERFAPRKKENKFFAQVFQALRIAVNDEMKALEEMLEQCEDLVVEGGRISIISYHSLEDRPVKNFINKGKISGEIEKDFYGNVLKPFKAINRKPIEATAEEIQQNARARSAKLRIGERIKDE